MIANPKKNLKGYSNIAYVESDLLDLRLPEKVDLIFSNAVIHWILDNNKLFTIFWELLEHNGEILIQCGGRGNLGSTHVMLEETRKSNRFRQYFIGWKSPWNFASPAETLEILNSIGFRDARAYLTKSTACFGNYQEFILYMKTVVMKPYLSYLPSNNNGNNNNNSHGDEIRDSFIGTYWGKLKEQHGRKKDVGNLLQLDYVRLNITGRK
jgi:trans-aconitate methyltransferase